MRVLVTGAAGFLGRAFVGHHARQADSVTAIDNLSNPLSYWPAPAFAGVKMVEADAGEWFENYELESSAGGGFDIAYHFAAPVGGRMKIDGDPLFNADSLRLDAAFFRWAARATYRRVGIAVYPSSSAVYPTDLQMSAPQRLYESLFDPQNERWGAPDQIYGLTKLVGENLAWRAASYGLSTLCIRPFSGYGEGQGLDYPIPSIARRAARAENPITIWGSGKQMRDLIHIDDIVGATVARISYGVDGYDAMNIGSGAPISFDEIATVLMTIAGHKAEIVHDETKPEGVQVRYADLRRMSAYYVPKVSIVEGLGRVLAEQRSSL